MVGPSNDKLADASPKPTILGVMDMLDETFKDVPQDGVDKEARSDSDAAESTAADGNSELATQEHHMGNAKGQRSFAPTRGVRTLWHLWRTLVVLSFLELALILGGTLVDHFCSPCRQSLLACSKLHADDCSGSSCHEPLPIWASFWPPAGLLCVAAPVRRVLRGFTLAPWLLLAISAAALAVIGTGATALVKISAMALHYAARCPMGRMSGHCSADDCPAPPCRRETEYSPCICGRVDEAEMARALFLGDTLACQPYEWYAWQMATLRELLLRYEIFACSVGPLAGAAAVVGGLLLLLQLVCFPVLLLGRCGFNTALLVLFASNDELDSLVHREMPVPEAPSKAQPSLQQPISSRSSGSSWSAKLELPAPSSVWSAKVQTSLGRQWSSEGDQWHQNDVDGDSLPRCGSVAPRNGSTLHLRSNWSVGLRSNG